MTTTLTQGELTVVVSYPDEEKVLRLQKVVEDHLVYAQGVDPEELSARQEITTLSTTRTRTTKFRTLGPHQVEELVRFLRKLLLSNKPFQVRYPSATEVEVSE